MRAIVQCFVLGFTLSLVAGCALAPASKPAGALPQQVDDDVQRLWWAVRFKIHLLPDKGPDWAADHLLAHAVVAPVLEKHAGQIHLWRFHRRAAPDGAGHQFSFIFYAPKRTADRIKADIQAHPVTQKMLAAGFVEKLRLNTHNYPDRQRVAATSDPNWTPVMQRNWPVFIMGVSALWLGLIDEYVAESGPVPTTAPNMLGFYRDVEEKMTAQWRDQGMHALFHHLSAVFGYEPLPVGEQEVRF